VDQGPSLQGHADALSLAHQVKALMLEHFRQALLEINEWFALTNQAPLRRPLGDVHTLTLGEGAEGADARLDVDHKLVMWMQATYEEGFQSEKGSLAIAAVKYLWPEFGHRGALSLPRAEQALRGWRRLPQGPPGPLPGLLPLPWEAVALIAEDLIVHGDTWLGVLTVLSFCCYFRPSEPLRLKGGDLIPPLDPGGLPFWSINLSSTSSAFGEAVVIDKTPFLPLLENGLRRLKSLRAVDELVFPFTQAEWDAAFQTSALLVGVADLKPCLYGLRHSGAIFDRATRARSATEVTLREGWRTDASVLRYT
jgi:hypothetical protein